MSSNDVFFELGYSFELEKRYDLAEEYYLMAIERNSVNAPIYLGILYYNQNKFIEAEKYYLMALENKDQYAAFNLGLLYEMKFNNMEMAEKYYKKCSILPILNNFVTL